MGKTGWRDWAAENSIWFFALGYFTCYVPYSFMTKLLSKGLIGGDKLAGFSLLPISVGASSVGMLVFLTAMGWWKHASSTQVGRWKIPHPTRWTLLSGLCTGAIIGTTTLAYTFEGLSIVFAMLLMRGGVLIIAPVVDRLTGRSVRWFSWVALGCAMVALLAGLADTDSYAIPVLAGVDIAVYLTAYFLRLRFMTRLAKSEDGEANRRYFVEEQMVAGPMLLLLLAVVALLSDSGVSGALRTGFVELWDAPFLWAILVVGVLSQGTGIFGSLIFLDKRENTFCVPVNRSSSILAGVIASYLVGIYPAQKGPAVSQLVGAGFILIAILFLTVPSMIEKRRLARAAAGTVG